MNVGINKRDIRKSFKWSKSVKLINMKVLISLRRGGEFPKKIKNNKKSPPFMRHLRVRSSKLCTLMIFLNKCLLSKQTCKIKYKRKEHL